MPHDTANWRSQIVDLARGNLPLNLLLLLSQALFSSLLRLLLLLERSEILLTQPF
jgi:hypothetical protein